MYIIYRIHIGTFRYIFMCDDSGELGLLILTLGSCIPFTRVGRK